MLCEPDVIKSGNSRSTNRCVSRQFLARGSAVRSAVPAQSVNSNFTLSHSGCLGALRSQNPGGLVPKGKPAYRNARAGKACGPSSAHHILFRANRLGLRAPGQRFVPSVGSRPRPRIRRRIMKTHTLPSSRSADFSERIESSEFGDLCIAAVVRGAERERIEKMASTEPLNKQLSACDWRWLIKVLRAFNAELIEPRCAVRRCLGEAVTRHGRTLCLPHWRELYRLAFAQRVDAMSIADDFARWYGRKVPPPRGARVAPSAAAFSNRSR